MASASTADGWPDNAVVDFDSAIVPVDPEKLVVPATSGVGSAAPLAALLLPLTSRVPPGSRWWSPSGVTPLNAAVPVAERYCTDQPLTLIAWSVGL